MKFSGINTKDPFILGRAYSYTYLQMRDLAGHIIMINDPVSPHVKMSLSVNMVCQARNSKSGRSVQCEGAVKVNRQIKRPRYRDKSIFVLPNTLQMTV